MEHTTWNVKDEVRLKKVIVWFRKDLRLHDNPALWEAAQQGAIIPVFIWSEQEELDYAMVASSFFDGVGKRT